MVIPVCLSDFSSSKLSVKTDFSSTMEKKSSNNCTETLSGDLRAEMSLQSEYILPNPSQTALKPLTLPSNDSKLCSHNALTARYAPVTKSSRKNCLFIYNKPKHLNLHEIRTMRLLLGLPKTCDRGIVSADWNERSGCIYYEW